MGTRFMTSSIASIYFDSYRSYCAVVESSTEEVDSFILRHLDATAQPLDFTRPLEEVVRSEGFQELVAMLSPLAGTVRQCVVSTTMENALAHQIPYSNTLTTDELRRLVRLEASEHLPNYDAGQFLATIYPLYGFAANPFMAMSVMLSTTITSVAEQVSRLLRADLQRLSVAQTSAHAALRYNYPEERGVVALLGLQRGYVDVSIVRNSVLLHTMTLSLEHELSEALHEAAELGYDEEKQSLERTGLGKLCFDALQNAEEAVQARIETAYFFGADLTKAALDEVSAYFADNRTSNPEQITELRRLNPLRYFGSRLDERMNSYCARVGHILTPCIGAALPEATAGIILSSHVPSSTLSHRKTA